MRELQSFLAPFANLAQLVEQLIRNEQVEGSNPLVGSLSCQTNPLFPLHSRYNSSLAKGFLLLHW
jgi:hypothetical protein